MSAARIFRAPGRVNLIGEHTDYNLGLVLPVALDLECRVVARAVSSRCLTARSVNLDTERSWPLDRFERRGDWGDYVAGVAVELGKLGATIPPADLEIRSTVPLGAGLASSAALEVAVGLALATLARMQLPPVELALACQRAESDFVGMKCGVMDQFVAALGCPLHALLIDCRTLQHGLVPLPPGADLVMVNTMVRHELASSEYNLRRRQCEEAAAFLGRGLRDADVEQTEALPDPARRRARHVISENERVQRFVAACQTGDLEAAGRLMYASHASLRDDYQVSCPELDFLVEAAQGLAGVLGARMTGGGFGGCTVNLVRPARVQEFTRGISSLYRERFGVEPAVYSCHTGAGASELTA